MNRILKPAGWNRPSGYSDGVEAKGRLVFVAGQIGTTAAGPVADPPRGLGRGGPVSAPPAASSRPAGELAGPDIVSQARQALANVLAVLEAARARPAHVVRMTWYVASIDEYSRVRERIGEVYRDVMGNHYPAMTLVEVSRLLSDARVEIEATAVVPENEEE